MTRGGVERICDHAQALETCLGELHQGGWIASETDLAAVGFKTIMARGVNGCARLDERVLQAMEAYSPLGTGRNLSDETVDRVARRVGRTPAQVLLRWCLQHDVPVISKSTHRERIDQNAQIFGFALSEQDMAELDTLDQTNGTDRALERKWW